MADIGGTSPPPPTEPRACRRPCLTWYLSLALAPGNGRRTNPAVGRRTLRVTARSPGPPTAGTSVCTHVAATPPPRRPSQNSPTSSSPPFYHLDVVLLPAAASPARQLPRRPRRPLLQAANAAASPRSIDSCGRWIVGSPSAHDAIRAQCAAFPGESDGDQAWPKVELKSTRAR